MVNNGNQIKPIKPADLISRHFPFTEFSDTFTIGVVSETRAFVITRITVMPEQYLAGLRLITLRFCRTGSSCPFGYTIPNNTMSVIDLGIGRQFTTVGQWTMDTTNRGGLPQNVANQIIVHVFSYYYDKES